LVEKVGSGGAISFKQYKVWIPEKVSVTLLCGFTVTVIDWGVPKQPLSNVFIVYTTVPLVFPEFNKVWEIVSPEPFEIPVTLVALAVHTIVAFGSEAIKFKEVVSFERIYSYGYINCLWTRTLIWVGRKKITSRIHVVNCCGCPCSANSVWWGWI
jgi:hypothetical protein